MLSLNTLILSLALSGTGETVLLDFTAPWCGPCQSMHPTIERLQAGGFPVRTINVDQQPQLAAQFHARSIPCFVMLVDGREVDRVVGATSYDRLVRMCRMSGTVDTQRSQPKAQAESALTLVGLNQTPPANQLPSDSDDRPRTASMSPQQRAFQATVRLTVGDPQGNSVGTGTIIDTHGSEALIVTCAHILRDSNGQGKIQVEVFAPGGTRTVQGQVVCYDMEKDVALISIHPGIEIVAVPVASERTRISKGDSVFTIGCNHGEDPTLQRSRVTAINRYVGPDNIEVAGQPVDGRSGGGLFSTTGELIGVCNAADPQDDEGLYAALSLVHGQLARIGMERLFQRGQEPSNQLPTTLVSNEPSRSNSPEMPPLRPVHNVPTVGATCKLDELLRAMRTNTGNGEVICIVRNAQSPGDETVVVLDQPACERLRQMAAGDNTENSLGPAVQSRNSVPDRHQPSPANRDDAGRIIRAQSEN